MEDTQGVIDTPTTNGALPRTVIADPNDIALSPNEMRALRAATGRAMSDIFTDDNEEDAMQAVVWLALRRQGHHATWDQAGDVGLRPVVPESDPTATDSTPS